MVDYLSDPRLKSVTFKKLKEYVTEKGSSESIKTELFKASTKFAIVNIAETHSIKLEPLLDEIGPYVAPTPKAAKTEVPK